ncbi:MAG: hypothetical protein LQ338_002816 [Usnochroma carphineum]|nr:MAG: hypothetical protein LQ338_002816 [Usnochroma carphineum]
MDSEAGIDQMVLRPSPSQESPCKPAVVTPEIDAVAEKKLVRKLDLFIIPIIMMLYLFSFLDSEKVMLDCMAWKKI